jgi:hypothetical protein
MDRSPYHLTGPPKPRIPPRRASTKAHFQQTIDEDEVSHSTPPLHTDEPIADLNPIFQPQFGSAGRYGSSRSMKAKHNYSDRDRDSHIISVLDTSRGRPSAVLGSGTGAGAGAGGVAGYRNHHNSHNHSHPLQWSAQDFRHSSSQVQQKQLPNRSSHGQQSESNGIIKYVKTTLSKRLYQVLRQMLQPKNEKPVSNLWLDGDGKQLKDVSTNDQRSRFLRYILPCILLVIANALGILPSRFFRRSNLWNRLEERHLNGRQCVMNLFVDKVSIYKFYVA